MRKVTLPALTFVTVLLSPLWAVATECRLVELPIVPAAGDFIPPGILVALVVIILNRRREEPSRKLQVATLVLCALLSAALGVALLSWPQTWERGTAISGLAAAFILLAIARPAPKGRISLVLACLLTLAGTATSLHAISGEATLIKMQCTGSGVVDEGIVF